MTETETERETHRERARDRETESKRETETDRQTDRQTETDSLPARWGGSSVWSMVSVRETKERKDTFSHCNI